MSGRRVVISNMDSISGWSLFNNDSLNLDVIGRHVSGERSIKFDKVNGAGNSKLAAIETTTTGSISLNDWLLTDALYWTVYFSAVTNLDYSFLRLGVDADNYLEWRFADTSHTAGAFSLCNASIGNAYIGGAGWNPKSIDYILVGAAFDAENNTLAGIAVDSIFARQVTLTA